MANEAAKLVSESLLGEDYKTVFLGGKAYTIHAPVTKVICQIVKEWSCIDFNSSKDQTLMSVISQIPKNRKPIIKGLCRAITGNTLFSIFKLWKLEREIDGTTIELNEAVTATIELMGAEAFFHCALSCESVTKTVAKPLS